MKLIVRHDRQGWSRRFLRDRIQLWPTFSESGWIDRLSDRGFLPVIVVLSSSGTDDVFDPIGADQSLPRIQRVMSVNARFIVPWKGRIRSPGIGKLLQLEINRILIRNEFVWMSAWFRVISLCHFRDSLVYENAEFHTYWRSSRELHLEFWIKESNEETHHVIIHNVERLSRYLRNEHWRRMTGQRYRIRDVMIAASLDCYIWSPQTVSEEIIPDSMNLARYSQHCDSSQVSCSPSTL
jgi:hypothetical protein